MGTAVGIVPPAAWEDIAKAALQFWWMDGEALEIEIEETCFRG